MEGWSALSPRSVGAAAYLLSTVMLLYLAGQCAYFSTHFPLGSVELGGFFPSFCGQILSAVLEFEIQDLSPLAVPPSWLVLEHAVKSCPRLDRKL